MSGLRWRINRANLADRAVRAAGADGLLDAVEFLGDESDRTTPIEESTLIRSRVSSVDRSRLRGAVSYDTPYAARQHEELDYRHDEGRRAKFLEQAFKEQGATAVDHVAKRIRAVLR